MSGKFYPAVHMGNFDNPHSALHSVGVTGQGADLFIAGMDYALGEPVTQLVNIKGEEEDAAIHPMLVLLPLEHNRVGLYLGFFGLLADSREAALMLAARGLIDVALSGGFETPPTLDAFPWTEPRSAMQ
ncbi:hypothetical protein G5S35_04465 [Paraburkholderia tropica]|uniref:hypothetical protein n=1 Tax=Paraburkholderia tropica TaxID=92647 RepID=UPI0016031CD2|nr:hypothetical protein [Paraburkholderia tropica]QNB10898.1 hypothetical protein G5S35_04465 [Paraburkholderia tropica]